MAHKQQSQKTAIKRKFGDAAKKINKLNIWMNGEHVGYWSKKAGVEELQYASSWIDSEQGRGLSLSLPFTPGNQKLRGDNVKYYFDNLLPDSSNIRERLAQKFNSKSASAFDLLVELGRDCVGAIQLLPVDEEPNNIKTIEYRVLTESDVANILRNIVSVNPLGAQESHGDLRISLAGAQEKTALLWHNKKWCEPLKTTPSTHIFKLPLGLVGNLQVNMHESVENEWLCSKIVAEFGIPVAHCNIGLFEDQKVLIVERFDRRYSADKNWIVRLPQEDMCQAKGISPLRKYQSDGGLGISDCMSILDRAVNPVNDKHTFFKSQIVFWLLCATDGHSKNFSIRHLSKDSYELTPLYDILSLHPIIGNKRHQIALQKTKMAMAIRGSKNYYHIYQIQLRHFIKQAVDTGISEQEVIEMISEIMQSVEAVIDKVIQQLDENFPKQLSEKIFQGMMNQSRKLSEQL